VGWDRTQTGLDFTKMAVGVVDKTNTGEVGQNTDETVRRRRLIGNLAMENWEPFDSECQTSSPERGDVTGVHGVVNLKSVCVVGYVGWDRTPTTKALVFPGYGKVSVFPT